MHRRAFALQASTSLAIVSLLAAPLAGCSGATSSLPSTPSFPSTTARTTASSSSSSLERQAQVDPQATAKPKLLFVSDNANNKISVFNTATKTQNPPPTRTITTGVDGPNGITTDKAGNLYVANYVNNTLTIYAPNASTPKKTISTGLNGPWDVKVDGFGNIYVANVPLFGSVPDFIAEYLKGSSSPSNTWTVPQQGMTISGIALLNPTQQGNTSIYALAYTLDGSGFAHGGVLSCYPGNATCVAIGYSFGQTGGVAIQQSPLASKTLEFLAVDQYVPGVDTFIPGQMTGQLVTGGTPEFITLNAGDNQLFVADRFYGRVVEYSFPAGKKINTFSPSGIHTQVYGVATFPAGDYH